MRYTLIKGSLHVFGLSHDGETICFQPDNTAFIDALETHLGGTHQDPFFGDRATQRMLELLRFDAVTFGSNGRVSAATPESLDGYILAKNLDSFDRVIAFWWSHQLGDCHI